LWQSGQYAEGQAAADSARKFVMWSVIIGIAVDIIYVIVMVASGGFNAGSNAAMLAAMF
jgi:hypothetical protein